MARKQSRLENEKLKIPRTYWQGLRDCHKLRELSLSSQRITTPLVIGARAFDTVAHSLVNLNIAGNGITDISALRSLQVLERLILKNNSVTSFDEVWN